MSEHIQELLNQKEALEKSRDTSASELYNVKLLLQEEQGRITVSQLAKSFLLDKGKRYQLHFSTVVEKLKVLENNHAGRVIEIEQKLKSEQAALEE